MKWSWKIGVYASVLCTLMLVVSTATRADIHQIRTIDVKSALDSGLVHLTIEPSFSGDSTKPFDGNAFTEMAMLASDSIRLTLSFDSLVTVEKSKVFFWNNGTWKMEGADSLADLESRSGSYRLLVDSNAFPSFAWDSMS